MSHDSHSSQASIGDLLGPSPYNEAEIASLRQRAWLEQAVCIVSAFDQRLTTAEARQVCRIAQRLYGQGGV